MYFPCPSRTAEVKLCIEGSSCSPQEMENPKASSFLRQHRIEVHIQRDFSSTLRQQTHSQTIETSCRTCTLFIGRIRSTEPFERSSKSSQLSTLVLELVVFDSGLDGGLSSVGRSLTVRENLSNIDVTVSLVPNNRLSLGAADGSALGLSILSCLYDERLDLVKRARKEARQATMMAEESFYCQQTFSEK